MLLAKQKTGDNVLDETSEQRLGGMALNNGLLVHSLHYWAAAIREDDGSITVASGKKKRGFDAAAATRVPLLRGLLRLVDALWVLVDVKAKLGNAVLPMETPRVAGAIAASAIATTGLRRRSGGSVLSQEIAAAVLSLAPALVALKGSSLAKYHGAEHVSIGEYEQELRGGAGKPVTKEHERCGSNLVGPLLTTALATNVVLRKVTTKQTPASAMLAGVLSIGSAMEIFRWMSRHPESTLSRVLGRPGRYLQQFLTTEDPNDRQMEVAHAALAELLRIQKA